MPLYESLYAAGASLAARVVPAVAPASSRLRRGVRGRKEALAGLEAWARTERDPARPVAWIHAPSVGEGLQARAVVEAAEAREPGRVQWIFTHFSPSAETLAERMPVAWAGYLPWDVGGQVVRALDAARPRLLVFTKTEVWPVLSRVAARRGVPTALVAATMPPSSSRTRWPAREILRPSVERLALVAAIADADAGRFAAAGARAEALTVAGDPGIDSAVARAAQADPDAPHLRPFRGGDRPLLVAGSTWPADEAVLLPALARVRERHGGLRLVIAPHEPGPAHVAALTSALARDGWAVATLGAVEAAGAPAGADAVVVDRVGVLAHLYTVADLAYVGGGFHRAGLHSVLEPAAAGIPVAFGPGHHNAWAADALSSVGGGSEVTDAAALARTLGGWMSDPGAARAAGAAARRWIDGHRGAADRTARALLELLSSTDPGGAA